MRRIIKNLITVIVFAVCLNIGFSAFAVIKIDTLITPIDKLKLDKNVCIAGLGEATHGNKEFQELKLDVFKALVYNNGCRVFAIEGDFGGCAKVNEYIQGGKGTSKDAVSKIGFSIYRTKEMESLVQWMHDYNKSAVDKNKLKFYGFDMQRYDSSKEYLFKYLNKADAAIGSRYTKLLADLNDRTVYGQDKVKIGKAKAESEKLISIMKANRNKYISKTSKSEYEFALECAQSIEENASLQFSGGNYSEKRDFYMKNKVDWILGYEGNKLIFINGHNGHIGKDSSPYSYHTMGSLLLKSYGSRYFAIGTDFAESEFNAADSNGSNSVFKVSHKNELTDLFTDTGSNINYINFKNADGNDEIEKIINTDQSMGSVGAEFNKLQSLSEVFYTVKMRPADSYDALIFVNKATPTNKQ